MLKLSIRSLFPYLLVFAVLYFSYRYNYLLFHTTIETFAFVVSASLFMLVWNARKIINNNFLVFLSLIYFYVGLINFFHILAYQGLPFFPQYGTTLSTQLWIAQRFLLAASLPISLLSINRKFNYQFVSYLYLAITVLLLLSIFVWQIFPLTYIDGLGLTAFKRTSEHIISTLLTISLFLLYRHRKHFDVQTARLLIASLIFNIAAELLFTIYFTTYDFVTVVAHILVLFSYYFIYKAIIEIGLIAPYRLLFLEIQELNLHKDELLHITSHELKNPLNNLRLYTGLLSHQITQKNNPKGQSIIHRIQNQTLKINRVINDLTDIGKIETGQLTLEFSQIDPVIICHQVIEEARRQHPHRQISFRASSSIPPISCDPIRIAQVIDNLISNALKYSPDTAPVKIVLQAKNKFLYFAVRDYGYGIAPQHLPLVFDKYFREKTGSNITGLGLGLYISKEIINGHKGKIAVTSRLKHGSTFYFYLPY